MIINFNKTKFYKKYSDKISEAFSYAIEYLKIPCKELELNLSFVSAREIRTLNRDFRDTDRVTDVLSFPNLLSPNKTNMQLIEKDLTLANFSKDIDRENNHIFLGDICICLSRAKSQAREYGNSYLREVVYLAVHGFLHLLGYDHMLESDKAIMRDREEKIMTHIRLGRE